MTDLWLEPRSLPFTKSFSTNWAGWSFVISNHPIIIYKKNNQYYRNKKMARWFKPAIGRLPRSYLPPLSVVLGHCTYSDSFPSVTKKPVFKTTTTHIINSFWGHGWITLIPLKRVRTFVWTNFSLYGKPQIGGLNPNHGKSLFLPLNFNSTIPKACKHMRD